MTLRRVPLRPVPPADHRDEPGYWEWHAPVFGTCTSCGHPGRLERHHVVSEQRIRAEKGEDAGAWCWRLSNSILLGVHCRCHSRQTTAAERLPASLIPPAAVAFAEELLGEDAAELYLVRYYRAG